MLIIKVILIEAFDMSDDNTAAYVFLFLLLLVTELKFIILLYSLCKGG